MTQAIDPSTQVFVQDTQVFAHYGQEAPGPASVTVEKFQATVALVNRFAELHPVPDVCESTAIVYQQLFRRIAAGTLRIGDTQSPRTFQLRKSAAQYELRKGVAHCLAQYHTAAQAADWAAAVRAIDLAHQCTKVFAHIAMERLVTERAPKKSKRQILGRFPKNWVARMYAGFQGSAIYRLPVAVLALCGCRPVELVSGIIVEVVADRDIKVTVKGAKVVDRSDGKGHGQKSRTMIFSPGTPWAADLYQAASAAGGRIIVGVRSAKRLHDAVTEVSARIFPRHEVVISPYAFRHAFAGALKASGTDTDTIAVALGHAVDKTQDGYGTARATADSGDLPSQVTGVRPVRKTKGAANIPRRGAVRDQASSSRA